MAREYRSCIRNKLFLDFEHDIGSGKNALACMLGFQLDAADEQMAYIAREIDQEKPDLIIYDFLAIYFKWCVNNQIYNLKFKEYLFGFRCS